jgi:uncharacterized protein YeaO (DUF488 family)
MQLPQVKRIYATASPADGTRILVDALWPRGLSRDAAQLDAWCKTVAPSAELRRWFGHDAARWNEFLIRYHAELDARPEAVGELRSLLEQGPATLVYAARDERHNNALALREYLALSRF